MKDDEHKVPLVPSKMDSDRIAVRQTPDSSATALMALVGGRVLVARKAMRLSRRALSERSGVSPRYIVRLEHGEGNISIGLLQRIAQALDQPIDSLVAPDDGMTNDIARLVEAYRNANDATRSSAIRILDSQQIHTQKAERICLIGLRGAGKSTLGARLGEALALPFVELNLEIERNAGMPVAEVIAMYGVDGYRKLEADTLQNIIETRSRLVLAVAGGVVEAEYTFEQVLNHFHTVWLKASPTEHMERVRAQGDLRPMAGNPQAMERLREILIARDSRYGLAEYQLDTCGKTVDSSIAELKLLVASHHIVTPNAL